MSPQNLSISVFLGNISGIEDDNEIKVQNRGYPELLSYLMGYYGINFLWEILFTRLIYFTDIRYVIWEILLSKKPKQIF